MKSNLKDTIEGLKIEYNICQDGYNSRDLMAEDEFSKLIQIFSIFITVLLAVNVFIKINSALHVILCVLIGIAGLVSQLAFLIGIASVSSSKVALRKRSIQIERNLCRLGVEIKYWEKIENRQKFWIEEIFKGKKGDKQDREESDSSYYVKSGYILIIIWVLLVFLLALFGENLQLNKI
ncbi:MAG: hypothetical protein MI892_22240 [Desulfobacterales bacterium]|nr:hypothetical protein [Desulfobacterales bacterium]